MSVRYWAVLSAIFAWCMATAPDSMSQNLLTLPALSTPASSAPPPVAAAPARPTNMVAVTKKAAQNLGLDAGAKLASWQTDLDRIEQNLRDQKLDYNDLNGLRAQLLTLRADAEALSHKLEPALTSASDDLNGLPPAPTGDQPPELDQAASTRADANGYVTYLASVRNSIEGTQNRITKLVGTILDIRRAQMTSSLSQRVAGMFSAATWKAVPGDARELAEKTRSAFATWWSNQEQDQIIPLAGIAVALWLGLSVLSLIGIARLKRCSGEPPFWLRASTAAGVIVLKSLPAAVPLVFLYNAIDELQPMPHHIASLFYSGARAIIVITVINALIASVLSPSDHRWRLIPASNGAAVRIAGLILAVAMLYGITTFLVTDAFVLKAPDTLKLAMSVVPYGVIALLVITILETPMRGEQLEGLPSVSWLRAIRVPVWLVAAAIIATALTGYLALSRFIAQQLIVTGTILAIVYLLLLWADGVAQAVGDESSGIGSWLANAGKFDRTGRQRLAVPSGLLLKFLVLLAAVPLILNQWRFPWPDILEWYRQLFFGFHIGNTQVSLGAILASIIVFILGFFAA